MTREEMDFIGSMNMCDEISNEAYAKIMTHCEEQEFCDDCISREALRQKLQKHYDFFVDAYGGFSNLPQNDKSRADEIINCISMVINAPSVTPQAKSCDNLISRQAVIGWLIDKDIIKTKNQEENARKELAELPSVTPQPKTGKWLEKEVHRDKIEEWQSARCSVCDRYHTTPYMYYFNNYKFCPLCGAKMEEET